MSAWPSPAVASRHVVVLSAGSGAIAVRAGWVPGDSRFRCRFGSGLDRARFVVADRLDRARFVVADRG
jgi:hypothetical protein